jgi:Tol biopolymer transport system component
MESFVSRRSILATASAIGLWLAAANGPSLADDDRSAPLAGGKSFLIAIPKFSVPNPRNTDIADRIRQVIIDRFSHLEPYALSRDATARTTYLEVDSLPAFSTWQSRNVQFLIIAQVDSRDGKLKVAARMWNVPDQKHFYGGQVFDQIENWQRAADFLADEISRHLPDQASASDRERPK